MYLLTYLLKNKETKHYIHLNPLKFSGVRHLHLKVFNAVQI